MFAVSSSTYFIVFMFQVSRNMISIVPPFTAFLEPYRTRDVAIYILYIYEFSCYTG